MQKAHAAALYSQIKALWHVPRVGHTGCTVLVMAHLRANGMAITGTAPARKN
jgi:hypothetical protein